MTYPNTCWFSIICF